MQSDSPTSSSAGASHAEPLPPRTAPDSARLVSLDALRGFDMFWIVGGSTIVRALLAESENPWLIAFREQFTHVEWEGFTFYDLIFPLFLFMIGVAIPFSLARRIARGDSRKRIYGHILARVVVLIVLGMMVNGNLLTYDPDRLQISYSVLQMLALGYLAASVLYLNLALRWQIVATAAMLIGYWLLLAYVPVPGHRAGVIQPQANVGDWLNDQILGEWQGRWRSGWILATLGHASTAMLGVFAGVLLRSPRSQGAKASWLVFLGLACLTLSLTWSGWLVQWLVPHGIADDSWLELPLWCEIIKRRWTSTYALYAAGWSYLLLAVFYLIVDVFRWRRWAMPLVVIGCNSIFAYMCWQLGRRVFYQGGEVFVGGLKPYVGHGWYEPLAWGAAMFLLWLLLWQLYRTKTFIRV